MFSLSTYRRKATLALAVMALFLVTATSALAQAKLDPGKWAPLTKARLEKMIDDNGARSSSYDPARKPYAVFDWDQTCVFNDISELQTLYILDTLSLKATPAQFSAAIREGVPNKNFSEGYENVAGQPVNSYQLISDIEADYDFLYKNYIRGRKMSLEAVKATPEYQDWQAKMAFLYYAAWDSFQACYPYYLIAGMTEKEAMAVTEKAIDRALGNQLAPVTFKSPVSRPGQAGAVSIAYSWGTRLMPEMANLMNVLRDNGIEVYVCSGSHEAAVKTFSTLNKYGYRVKPENVVAIKTVTKGGRYQTSLAPEDVYPATWEAGKTVAIKKLLMPKHGGRGPLLVAGDSNGDYHMATDFPDTQVTLIINRLRKDDWGKLGLKAEAEKGRAGARYVLQGRDENTGQFRPEESTIKMGQDKAVLLNPALTKKQ